MKDLQQLEKKGMQNNKTAVNSLTKKKSVVIPGTAQRKKSGTGGSAKNVNYEEKIRQLEAKLFGK